MNPILRRLLATLIVIATVVGGIAWAAWAMTLNNTGFLILISSVFGVCILLFFVAVWIIVDVESGCGVCAAFFLVAIMLPFFWPLFAGAFLASKVGSTEC